MATVKCRYKYCKHETQTLNREEAVLVGKSSYYHPDCLRESQLINEIVDVYTKRVDKNPIYTHLRKTVNNIVVNKKVDAEFLLFALNYAADNNMIKHVPGLYYIVKNEEIKRAWNKKKTSEFIHSEKQKKPQYINNKPREFTYNSPKQKTIGSLFG